MKLSSNAKKIIEIKAYSSYLTPNCVITKDDLIPLCSIEEREL